MEPGGIYLATTVQEQVKQMRKKYLSAQQDPDAQKERQVSFSTATEPPVFEFRFNSNIQIDIDAATRRRLIQEKAEKLHRRR